VEAKGVCERALAAKEREGHHKMKNLTMLLLLTTGAVCQQTLLHFAMQKWHEVTLWSCVNDEMNRIQQQIALKYAHRSAENEAQIRLLQQQLQEFEHMDTTLKQERDAKTDMVEEVNHMSDLLRNTQKQLEDTQNRSNVEQARGQQIGWEVDDLAKKMGRLMETTDKKLRDQEEHHKQEIHDLNMMRETERFQFELEAQDQAKATEQQLTRLRGELHRADDDRGQLQGLIHRTEQEFAFEKLKFTLDAPPMRRKEVAWTLLTAAWHAHCHQKLMEIEMRLHVKEEENATLLTEADSLGHLIASVRAESSHKQTLLEGMLGTVVESAKYEITAASSQLEQTLLDRDQAMAGIHMTLIDKEEKWLAEKLSLQTTLKDRASDIESLESEVELLRSVVQQMEASACIMQTEFVRICRRAAYTLLGVVIQRRNRQKTSPLVRMWREQLQEQKLFEQQQELVKSHVYKERALTEAFDKLQTEKASEITEMKNRARREVTAAMRRAHMEQASQPQTHGVQSFLPAQSVDEESSDESELNLDFGLDLKSNGDDENTDSPTSPQSQDDDIAELNRTLDLLQNSYLQ